MIESPTKLAATKKKAKGFWLSSENRRQFFCNLAGEKGFDPNDNAAWARVTKEDIITREVCNCRTQFTRTFLILLHIKKGGRSILQHYPSFRKAIKAALPSITFVSDNGELLLSPLCTGSNHRHRKTAKRVLERPPELQTVFR